MPDGSVIAPSYDVAVSDGLSTIPSRAAVVTFNQAPLITVNPMILDQGSSHDRFILKISAPVMIRRSVMIYYFKSPTLLLKIILNTQAMWDMP